MAIAGKGMVGTYKSDIERIMLVLSHFVDSLVHSHVHSQEFVRNLLGMCSRTASAKGPHARVLTNRRRHLQHGSQAASPVPRPFLRAGWVDLGHP